MLSDNDADPYGRRRDSNLACSRQMVERRLTMASTSGWMFLWDAMDKICVRLSLACLCREAQAEHLQHPIGPDMLPSEVLIRGRRRDQPGVGGPITVGSEVSGTLAWSRTWGGDGGGTISGLSVDADMCTTKAGTDVGGAFLSSDVIIWGWCDWYRPVAACQSVPGW